MLPLAATAFLLAIIFLILSARRQSGAGLPGGRVIYTDMRTWGKVEKPLYDPILDITGKPDYLVQDGKEIIPVEVKTGRTPTAPYDNHIFQLATYCFLVERTMGKRPSYGIIKYPTRTFSIEYTSALEQALIDVIADIRAMQKRRSVARSHESAGRCHGCGFRNTCEDSLI